MKIVFTQSNLLRALNLVQRAISSKSTHPILQGILISTEEDVVRFVGTDLDFGIETYIDGDVIESGNVVVPTGIFHDIIRRLPQGDIIFTRDDNHKVEIKSHNSVINIQGFDAIEYPDLQTIEQKGIIEIEEGTFKDMIQRSIFAVSQDESRPLYMGALLEKSEDNMTIACLDGYRLAIRSGKIKHDTKETEVIIPGQTLNEISRIIGNSEKKLSIIIGEKHVLFDLGYTRIISRSIKGEFLNYKQIVPRDYEIRVKVDTSLLASSIDRAYLIAREGENDLIKFIIKEDILTITSNSEIGSIFEQVPILLEGGELEIAFNGRYFLDILKAIEDDEICLDFTTNINPCVIKPLNKEDEYTYFILPVRLFI
ncbi:MAG: DNA polymerase III subunit beta [Clostridiales bacterium]|nr:DNA polymerase III subunit beta [Clostridiales bacterium]